MEKVLRINENGYQVSSSTNMSCSEPDEIHYSSPPIMAKSRTSNHNTYHGSDSKGFGDQRMVEIDT